MERQLKNGNAKFYVVKRKEYYGFFLISKNGVSICAGGRIKKIKKKGTIEEIYNDFSNMINIYLKLLLPYRNAQEKISNSVKSFGGSGKIHGCIIDIDFYNHIMLNPSDGKITYYYSPDFGIIKCYDSLNGLLSNHNKFLQEKYLKQLNNSNNKEISLFNKIEIEKSNNSYINIDIKNSVYSISNRINQLQRLFEKKVLRDWNEELLNNKDRILYIPEF